MSTNDTQALPELPARIRWLFCTKCGYSGETSAPMPHAACENPQCGYMAFVSEKDYTADDMRAYALASRQDQQGQAWQDIASAPLNRTVLVGYYNRSGNWRTIRASYYLAGTLPMEDEFNDAADDDGYAPAGWYEESETHETLLPVEHPPELWQPIPAAPSLPVGKEPTP